MGIERGSRKNKPIVEQESSKRLRAQQDANAKAMQKSLRRKKLSDKQIDLRLARMKKDNAVPKKNKPVQKYGNPPKPKNK
jgi:hypothetical protein